MKTLTYQIDAIPRELQRTEAIQDVQPQRMTTLRSVAQNLSRRGVLATKAELCNQVLVAFVEVLFETDDDGVSANVDATGMVLIPAPFGRGGGPLWGLRATEQRTLNVIMRQRSEAHSEPLFVYAADNRRWLLGRPYTSRRTAMAYLRSLPVTVAEWRAAWQETRSQWARKNLGDW